MAKWVRFCLIRAGLLAVYERPIVIPTKKEKRSIKRSLFAVAAFLFLSGITAMTQEVRNEVSVQATGFFTKDSNGQGISQQTTESGGVLAGYRYRINRWFSAEAKYGYNRSTEGYFTSPVRCPLSHGSSGCEPSFQVPQAPSLRARGRRCPDIQANQQFWRVRARHGYANERRFCLRRRRRLWHHAAFVPASGIPRICL